MLCYRSMIADNTRHYRKMGVIEIEAFLSYLAVERNVSASTQNQALSVILFLYQEVLNIPIEGIYAIHAKSPVRIPIVLSMAEVDVLLTLRRWRLNPAFLKLWMTG